LTPRGGTQKEAAEHFCWTESDDSNLSAEMFGGFFLLRPQRSEGVEDIAVLREKQ